MFRVKQWVTPLVALGLAFVLNAPTVRAADAEKKETGTISGKVVDEAGKPAANIQVRLTLPRQRGGGGGGGGGGGATPAPAPQAAPGSRPAPIATETTDAEGAFTMKD